MSVSTYHDVVGFDSCHDTLEAFILLAHRQVGVYAAHEMLHRVNLQNCNERIYLMPNWEGKHVAAPIHSPSAAHFILMPANNEFGKFSFIRIANYHYHIHPPTRIGRRRISCITGLEMDYPLCQVRTTSVEINRQFIVKRLLQWGSFYAWRCSRLVKWLRLVSESHKTRGTCVPQYKRCN